MNSYEHSKAFSEISIKNVKTYWNNRPCNLKHSTAIIGSEKYFQEISPRKFFVEPHLIEFVDFPSVKGKKVWLASLFNCYIKINE